MTNLESNLNNLSETFDKLNEIRETSLTISRDIVRDCSKSIRFIHRNDIKGAEEFINSAKKKIIKLKKLTEKVSEISFAGYVLDAEREYVEAVLFYIYESKGHIEPFEKFNVQNNCKVSKASTEIMLYRVCNGNEIDFPFSN